MNKQLLCFALFFLLMWLTLPLVTTAQVVDIPDPNLRAAIEAKLGKAAGATITVDDMATLTELDGHDAGISNLIGLEFATNLIALYLWDNSISDLSPLADLTKLEKLGLNKNLISDISPLAKLTQVRWLRLQDNSISDISPLASLIGLQDLAIYLNSISDLSPLAGLTGLKALDFGDNLASDFSPLAGLINLEGLHISGQPISDLSPLSGLTKLTILGIFRTPISDLSPLAGLTNLERLNLRYNSISDLSPLVANTGLGDGDTIVIYGNPLSDISINTHIPTLRNRGVKVHNTKLFFPTINPVSVGDTFTLSLAVEDVVDLAGWQLDIAFNPSVLKAVSVGEGDFLSKDGGSTFFTSGNINNTTGTITDVSGAFIGTGGISGTGTLLEITFEAEAPGEGSLRLGNVQLGDPNQGSIPHEIVINPFIFKPRHDVNGDGNVNIFDLILIAQNFNKANPQADVNGDGTVNIFDLIAVAQNLGKSTTSDAPSLRLTHTVSLETIQAWIDRAHAADDGSLAFQLGIANLQRLLAAIRPETTALLANYPNPFNPETWIPYQLAHAANVTLTIYDIKGAMMRRLDLGHQMAGYYADRTKAAYWDGRNNLGEPVGSGVYFYQLQAEDFSAMRKMVILK